MHFTRDFWRYTPATDTWTKLIDYPGAKPVGALGFALQDKGYVFEGGFGSLSAPLLNFPACPLWSYDPQANTWQQKTPLSLPGDTRGTSATVFTISEKAHVAIGGTNATNVNGQLVKHDFWQYDPTSNTWGEKPQVGGPVRWFPSSFAVNGKGYVGMGTGTTIFELFSDFWQYNPG